MLFYCADVTFYFWYMSFLAAMLTSMHITTNSTLRGSNGSSMSMHVNFKPRLVYICTNALIALMVQIDLVDEMFLDVPICSKQMTVSINGIMLTNMTLLLSVTLLCFCMIKYGTS